MSNNWLENSDQKLFVGESSSSPEHPFRKQDSYDKTREKVESLAQASRVSFESKSAIKANMARELYQMGLDSESIRRVLHPDANQVAEWIDTGLKGGRADG